MLLWKDYRLNRMLLILSLVLLIGPYLVCLLWSAYSSEVPAGSFHQPAFWAGWLLTCCVPSLMFSQLPVALLAANAVASERADRSAEFLGYLPPSRARILTSKAILVFAPLVLACSVNIVAAFVAPALSEQAYARFTSEAFSLPSFFVTTIATGLLALGAGWFASCVLDSPAFSAAISIVTPLLLYSCFGIANLFLAWPCLDSMQAWYTGSCLFLGPLTFAAGAVYYLRRVEP